jgi:hypothetical protein
VIQSKGRTLQDRSYQRSFWGGEGKSAEDASSIGVPERRPLSRHVRQENNAAAPKRNLCRLFGQEIKCIRIEPSRPLNFNFAQLVAKPPQAGAGGNHGPHEQMDSWDGMGHRNEGCLPDAALVQHGEY